MGSGDQLTFEARRAWTEARSVLFVCLGNVCRSPFAEFLARERLEGDKSLLSAGSYPAPGRGVPGPAVAAAATFGVDLASHRSRVLTRQMLEHAEAVFVFDEDNHRAVVSELPGCAPRVHMVGALSDDGLLLIPDPFGGPAAEYEFVYGEIARAIEAASGSGSRLG